MDEQVPRQITAGLRLRGVDVLTVQEDERLGTPDPILLDRATELQRVMFSRDDDFLAEAHRPQCVSTNLDVSVQMLKAIALQGEAFRQIDLG